ncbi:MAG: hypothetical protein MN733_25215 [Nitrososphaera sp.]|nr:hypothetical protein [Nitrososphaera sp.]
MPKMSITIGVTGHRVLAGINRVITGIDAGLDFVHPYVGSAKLIVASSLAEGADRIVVGRVFAHFPNARLVVVLPFNETVYIRDFVSQESRQEFKKLMNLASQVSVVPSDGSREGCYAAACNQILNVTDVLFSIWDGKPAQGMGGTAEMVEKSRRLNKKIIWVHAGNREAGGSKATTLGDWQGLVTFENFGDCLWVHK